MILRALAAEDALPQGGKEFFQQRDVGHHDQDGQQHREFYELAARRSPENSRHGSSARKNSAAVATVFFPGARLFCRAVTLSLNVVDLRIVLAVKEEQLRVVVLQQGHGEILQRRRIAVVQAERLPVILDALEDVPFFIVDIAQQVEFEGGGVVVCPWPAGCPWPRRAGRGGSRRRPA